MRVAVRRRRVVCHVDQFDLQIAAIREADVHRDRHRFAEIPAVEADIAEYGPRADVVAGAPARDAAVEVGDHAADLVDGAGEWGAHVVSVADASMRTAR